MLLLPLSRRLRRSAKALSAEVVEYSNGVQEIILMAEETQVFGALEAFRRSIHGQIERVRGPLFRTRFLTQAVPALFQSVALVILVVVLVLTLVYFLDTEGIAQLGAVVLILIRWLTYGQQVQTAATRMDELLPFMDRLRLAMDDYLASPSRAATDRCPASSAWSSTASPSPTSPAPRCCPT